MIGIRNPEDGVKAAPQGKYPMLCEYGSYGTNLVHKGAVTWFVTKALDHVGKTMAEEAYLDALYCFWFLII